MKGKVSADSVSGAVLDGMNMPHILSVGMAALPENANSGPGTL